jgi:hypothetical protein
MIYVFDTSAFRVLNNFYPSRFPSLWTGVADLIAAGRLVSVREVLNELNQYLEDDFLKDWARNNRHIFVAPTNDELTFVAKIFSVQHFRTLISQKSILKGTPVADPFVIAVARVKRACVVTQEAKKPNAAKIPNICEHFGIDYTNLEGFMKKEDWAF